jgi:hypothetical protein
MIDDPDLSANTILDFVRDEEPQIGRQVVTWPSINSNMD